MIRFRHLLLAAVIGFTTAMVFSQAPASAATVHSSWPMDGHDAAHSGLSPSEKVLNSITIGKLRYKRSFVLPPPDPNSYCYFNPPHAAVIGGTMYDITGDHVAAFNIGTGRRLWRHVLDASHQSTYAGLAVRGGRVFVGSTDCESVSEPYGQLWAFNAANGTLLWQTPAGPVQTFTVSGSVLVARDVGSPDGPFVFAVDAKTGAGLWDVGDGGCGDALVVGGIVPTCEVDFSTPSVTLEGRSLSTGAVVWRRPGDWMPLRGDTDQPTAQDMYVHDPGGHIAALNPATGRVKWDSTTAHGDVLAVGTQRIFVTCGTDGLCALSRTDGHRLWKSQRYAATKTVAVAADLVYPAPDFAPLRASTGAEVAVTNGYPTGSTIVVAGGRVVSTDGRIVDIYALP